MKMRHVEFNFKVIRRFTWKPVDWATLFPAHVYHLDPKRRLGVPVSIGIHWLWFRLIITPVMRPADA